MNRTAAAVLPIATLTLGIFIMIGAQQQQYTAFGQTAKLVFIKSAYVYSGNSPHYWFYAQYYNYNYGPNGQLVSWYNEYKWWYSYPGWNGPWTYWGEQDYLVCSIYSYSQPCARV